ncbi:MAG: hypothetical protein KY476_13140, partial [Planctomycetes bacterium]|nr:hypothetical protein [Planctomycetota bacterium]
MSTLTFEPLISPALWLTLAALTAALLAWYGWRRPPGVSRRRWSMILGLMSAAACAVLAILLNPTWLLPIPPPAGKPLLSVLVDRSASMATGDVDGASRHRAAADIARRVTRDLGSRFDVRVRTFAEMLGPADVPRLDSQRPDGELTDLAGAIAGSLEADRPQGQALLVLSDGIHNAPSGIDAVFEVVERARAMAAPIYTTTLGGQTIRNDLEVDVVRPQELSFLGQRVPITIVLRQRGAKADRTEVVLLQDGTEVARQTVPLVADGDARTELAVQSETVGLSLCEVRVEPRPWEATAANNSATIVLRVTGEPMRVLLLEGKPYWDAKFLIRTLSFDPSLELDSIVRLSASRFFHRRTRLTQNGEATGTAAAAGTPVAQSESIEMLSDPGEALSGPEALQAYQVIVLGRDAEAFLDTALLERLRTWIARDGGSLVCYRGSPVAQVNQELARLLPVRWSPARESRYRISLTPRGEDLNWLGPHVSGGADALARLPSLARAGTPQRPKPLAVVLATADADAGPPAVTYQPYGVGRVVTIEGAGMWRWAF